MQSAPFGEVKREGPEEEIEHIEQQARMVLPGIQALFGFQLIAVFNAAFKASLTPGEKSVHLVAMTLIVIAILLVMAPAAYHRQAERHQVSRYLVDFSNRLVTLAMIPLVFALILDFYVVARVITEDRWLSGLISATLFLAFTSLWFIFPQFKRAQRKKWIQNSELRLHRFQKK